MKRAILLLAGAGAAGCASQPVPTGDLAAAEREISLAVRSGAAQFAPRELALAQEKIALSRRSLASGDRQPARWLAQQAQVDAELAAVKSQVRAAPKVAASRP